MPRLSHFYGISVYMYFGDHAPPHVHAVYGGDEALLRIDDGSVVRGGLPRTAARLVKAWMAAHRDELLANWERAQRAEALFPIEPLR